MSITSWLLNRAVQWGLLEDEALCVLIGGPANTTTSDYAAENMKGYAWAKWLCAALSVLVQKNHCQKQLNNQPMTVCNYIRAFLCITVFFAVLGYGAHFVWRMI